MELGLSLLSITVAGITILTVFYHFGQQGQIIKSINDDRLPGRMANMEAKLEILWLAFADQNLSNRPDLANRGSGYKLTEAGKDAVSEIMGLVYQQESNNSNNINRLDQLLLEVPQTVGIDKIKEIAGKHNMRLGELLAVLSIELGIDV